MISINRFHSDDADFAEQAGSVLALLAVRPGFVRGHVARSTDDAASWVLVTEWRDVGSYRRGLSGYEVKVGAWPLLGQALPEPSAFEILQTAEGDPAQG